ncbi:MAG: GntR family transcriptional regulator [Desulfovibrionaceae bacterium]|nr:GntR family transcriptional regulator [Desulfovibrionaceae bacterium]
MLLKKETYSSQAANIIRQMIRDGELRQGEPVKESLLAARLSISRAPIREALQELYHEGLVTSEPQKGKRVRLLMDKDILDSYAVGAILEAAGVADSLADWTEGDMLRLHAVVDDMRNAGRSSADLSSMMGLDDLFHATLLQRCGNARLVEMARLSCVTISKVLCYRKWLTLFSPGGFAERHAAIAEAACARDAARVGAMLRTHYREISERIIAR